MPTSVCVKKQSLMKKSLLKNSNALLAAILALFGISSCEQADLYGSPYSEYIKITGLVQNESNQPIESIQVVSNYRDTVYTDAAGNFDIKKTGGNVPSSIKLFFNDTDGPANGSYQNDSADVHITYSGGDGEWNAGIGRGSVTKTLKEKTE